MTRAPKATRGRYQFTPEDRRRGWRTTITRHPHLGLWLLQRCRLTRPAGRACEGKYY